MPVRLFVGNLPYDVTEPELKAFFSAVGTLSSVIIPVDRETGKRRGFAFVEFSDAAQAAEAIRRFNNQPFKERPIVINEARARENRTDSGPGARSGFPMRSASGAPRPLGSRPAFDRPDFASNPIEDGLGGRAQRRNRNFGPDAKPVRKRKTFRGSGGSEMGGKKRPIRERVGGQFFGGHDDDDYENEKDLELWPDIDLANENNQNNQNDEDDEVEES